jgi:uncharacterized protein (DUF4415 family)
MTALFAFSPRARRLAAKPLFTLGEIMREEYDFSKASKNPYASRLKRQITIRLDEDSVSYFKSISETVGIPYQSLINLYLRDCATSQRKLNLKWK